MPSKTEKYRLKIESKTDNLRLIRDFVRQIAEKVGFDDDDLGNIELAVDEACANVISHAYNQNLGKNMDVEVRVGGKKFMVIVTDRGRGFNPDSVPTPDIKEFSEKRKHGGLGLFLIRSLMDEVSYDIRPGVKNCVRLTKYMN